MWKTAHGLARRPPLVTSMAYQFDQQVYGIEIAFP
jgi:hypothetical protein